MLVSKKGAENYYSCMKYIQEENLQEENLLKKKKYNQPTANLQTFASEQEDLNDYFTLKDKKIDEVNKQMIEELHEIKE